MSQENVEIVRGCSPSLVRPAPGCLHPTLRSTSRSPTRMRRSFAESKLGAVCWPVWERTLKLEPEQFFDVDDDRVLVFIRGTAVGEGSGVPVERRTEHNNSDELSVPDSAEEGSPEPSV